MSTTPAMKAVGSRGEQSTAGTLSQEDSQSSLTLVCQACRTGPFSYEGFRQAISEYHYDETTGYCYTTTWSDIFQSINNDACNWCCIVRRTRDGLSTEKFPSTGQESVEVRLQVSAGKYWRNVRIYLNGFEAATYDIYANSGDSTAKEIDIVPNHPTEPYVDYAQALECIDQCSKHEHCPSIEETYLPTRVIDCSDPSKPHLVETHRQIRGRYCALSYVWGGKQHQKTTTSNIDTYIHEGIKIPLPQTIADAISVTNKIGIRYLWVDALCIIQDSIEDKINELGIMANIYRNAFLTISAQSAFRADQGFLPDERAPDILPFHLKTDGTKASPGRMLLEYNIPGPWLLDYKPLEARGWCLQESALSPRRLIFEPPFLSYKCRSFKPRGVRRGSVYQTLNPVNDYILFPGEKNHCSTSIAENLDDQELYRQWRRILFDYTKRKITVPSDKFVALASITELFQSLLRDRYIAGLWRRNLLDDLLWEVDPPMGSDEFPLPRPVDYRAPTWSWASVDRHLRNFNFSYSPLPSAASYEAEILACEATPKISTLPFGEVADARLTMKVKMHPLMRNGRKCSFIKQKGTNHHSLGAPTSWSWTPPPGHCLEPSRGSVDGENNEVQTGQQIREVILTFDCLEGTEDREIDFYIVVLRAGRQGKILGDWMQGLVVLPVDGKVDQYRRVTKFDLQYPFEWPDWFDAMPLKTVTLI